MIKKKIILFLMLVVDIVTSSLGQGIEYRSQIDFPKNDYHVSLILFENHYYFDLVYDKSDVCVVVPLSIGKYEKFKDNYLIMHDDVNGFDMIMLHVNDSCIIVDKGLCFADSLRLDYYRDIDDKYVEPLKIVDDIDKDKAILQPQTVLHDFLSGKYEIIHPGAFMLDIHEDMSYEYYINQEIIVSEGVYERHGNLIMFFDNCVGEIFTAIIGDGYILGRYFLGDRGDKQYRIIPEDEYMNMIPLNHRDSLTTPNLR